MRIGDVVTPGQTLGEVEGEPVVASIDQGSFRFQHLSTDQVRFATAAGVRSDAAGSGSRFGEP